MSDREPVTAILETINANIEALSKQYPEFLSSTVTVVHANTIHQTKFIRDGLSLDKMIAVVVQQNRAIISFCEQAIDDVYTQVDSLFQHKMQIEKDTLKKIEDLYYQITEAALTPEETLDLVKKTKAMLNERTNTRGLT